MLRRIATGRVIILDRATLTQTFAVFIHWILLVGNVIGLKSQVGMGIIASFGEIGIVVSQ